MKKKMIRYRTLRNTRRLYFAFEGILFLCLILLVFPRMHSIRPILLIGAFLGLVCSSYFDYIYWRCPHCGKHLGRRMLPAPTGCPHCRKTFTLDQRVASNSKDVPPKENTSR